MDNGLFTPQDLEELSARGITPEAAAHQVEEIRKGFPYLEILASASLEQGILRVETSEEAGYMDLWEEYLLSGKASVYKMVPASGAASRMFKMLYNFLEAPYTAPEKPEEERFFSHINQFAFYERLNEACLRNNWKSIPKLIAAGEYKAIVENLLLPKGLGYGSKPKALLLFHNYKEAPRTSAEEHLVEGALYARDREGMVRLHFTVSPEHRKDFEALVHSLQSVYEDLYGVRYDISFSEQLPSTDTLALTPDGELFRTDTGHLLFRPGGHGALIHNLGKLPTDVVFIKNIDNVVPDPYKGTTIMYKKFLGGVLIALRRQIFSYLTLSSDLHTRSSRKSSASLRGNYPSRYLKIWIRRIVVPSNGSKVASIAPYASAVWCATKVSPVVAPSSSVSMTAAVLCRSLRARRSIWRMLDNAPSLRLEDTSIP